jgi:hypothetical protein
MAVPSSPMTSHPLSNPTELAEMLPSTQHALEIFPSEGNRHRIDVTLPHRPHRSGVVMRVEPISRGAVWALAAILLAGAGSVAVIGLLLVGRA